MTGGSFCSIETKSTAEIMSSQSLGGEEETISLPDNIRALLNGSGNASHQRLLQQDRKVNHDNSLSSLDETLRRDILNPGGSNALKQWNDPSRRHDNMDAARGSFVSPDKTGCREKLEHTSIHTRNLVSSRKNSGRFPRDESSEEKSDFHEKPMPVVSSDDSEFVRKPQPHDDGGYYPEKAPSSRTKEPEEELSPVLQKYKYPRKSSRNELAKEKAQSTSNLFLRMSRQMKTGRRGSLPNPHRRNRIKLHIYDLIPAETVMQLPWGCMLPIGRCFDAVNSSLHSMGTGAYHVGVEVNGVEYSFGACDIPGHTGVFSCVPKRSPGYQFRTTIDFGERSLVKKAQPSDDQWPDERYVDGREIIKQMATEYMGIDYDLLRKNCVTFASDACIRLGVEEKDIPSWFRNLCESGALTQDVALQTVEPIQNVFSACEDYGNLAGKTIEDGFEIITKEGKGFGNVVMVIDADDTNNSAQCTDCTSLGVRQTLSWAY